MVNKVSPRCWGVSVRKSCNLLCAYCG